MKHITRTALAVWLACIGCIAYGAATDQEIARLGKDLTPVGAEKAGNKDGSIPEWTGGNLTAPPGWKPGQKRIDPYKDDKPLFSVDASNVDKYKDKLSEGQVTLVKTLKGYRMDVYPTRRSCGYPDFVYERTKVNAKEARLDSNGWGLKQAIGAAIIFPIPKTGVEAMWNHKLRYIGEGRDEYSADIIVQKSGDFTPLAIEQTWITPLHNRNNKGIEEVGGVEAKLISAIVSPAARAGELTLAHGFFNEPQVAWLYFPGQRRVRRVPTYVYDNPIVGYEGLVTIDQYPMFSGNMDRYDWKLVGKQEMYIPYNNWKLIDKSRKYKDVYGPQFVNRDLMRYELHRVWKVEATLKQGMRHVFPRRVFYLDEDSWAVMAADHYDAQGRIWRVQESSIYVAPEIPACVGLEFVSYDLAVGRYLAMGTTQESPETDWLAGRKGIVDPKRFNPDELRRMGDR
ncbi:MAG: DUF1329 domain-containing protein [Betaproteobacteria bacterium]|nr:DUF1329 domain-containing protein [Betaproteobacteria bacterium]